MADAARLTVAVLAAGQSRRFGTTDKLCAPFQGKPLGLHVCDMLARARFALRPQHRLVVASDETHPCARGWKDAGFSVVRNPNADEGMGTSVATAARIARRAGSDMLLIALADMPLVPVSHYAALVSRADASFKDQILASFDGHARMPPAVFGRGQFDILAQLSADTGARAMLANSETVDCPPEWLADIDTPEALAVLGQES